MVAAILRRELIGSGRSGRLYAIRAGYLVLLSLLVVPWLFLVAEEMHRDGVQFNGARHGREFVGTFGVVQILLVSLVAPALAAGAILRERASGALDLLHASGVGAGRLVLGKFAARMSVLAVFLLSGAPLLFAGTVVGGAGAELVALVLVEGIAFAALGTALGLASSALFRRPVAVVLVSYVLLLLVCIAPLMVMSIRQPSQPWQAVLSPFLALLHRSFGQVGATVAFASAVPLLALAGVALLAAVSGSRVSDRERVVAAGNAGIELLEGRWRDRRRPTSAVAGAPLPALAGAERRSRRVQGNPVAWREATNARYSFAMRATRLLYVSLGGALAVHLFVFAVLSGWEGLARAGILFLAPASALLALVAASTSITGERETGALLLLQASRLAPLDVVIGKIQGLWRFLWPAIVLPLVPGLAFLGIDNGAVALTAIATLVLLLTGTALGLFFSAVCRRSMTAIGGALTTVVLWVAGVPIAVVAIGGMLLRADPHSRTALLLDWGLAATNPLVMTKYLADSFGSTPEYLVRLHAVPNTTPPLIGLAFFVLLSMALLQAAAWRLGREQA